MPPRPPARPEEGIIGSGGCVAFALTNLGVFADVATAKARLDRSAIEIEEVLPEGHAYVPGDWWHAEAVKRSVLSARHHWSKLKLDKVDLAVLLQRGDHVIDGTLNDSFRKGQHEYSTAPDDDGPGPARDPRAWRHAAAVRDGVIMEQQEQHINAKWLWLDRDTNRPDANKGYLLEILKVYAVRECRGGEGCRGECSRAGGGACRED